MRQALHVHECEADPWDDTGPEYVGGLGWRPATWQAFRTPSDPLNMADATPVEQASALGRFAQKYGMPDLNGTCAGY